MKNNKLIKNINYNFITLLTIVFVLPSSLRAEFFFNDYLNGSFNYNSSAKELNKESNFVDLRLDNRAVAGYKSSFFKAEVHLLTSVSNFSNSALQIPIDLVIEDDKNELFDFTNVRKNNNSTITNKLDRLNFSFFGDNYNLSLGRSAITWSRGRMFHVTDFFNPQIPGFYDGDYKQGTDLISFSYALSRQHNIAIAYNPKRNYLTNNVTFEDSNMGFRYLYNNESMDISFILGQYLKDYVIATGFSTDFLFSSVLRTDLSVSKPYEDRSQNIFSTTVGLEKSLLLGSIFTNVFAEYYYNGFGSNKNANSSNYLNSLSPSLIRRLQEQDTYLVSKNYLSLGLNMELGTYFNVSYSNVISLKDGSAFHFVGASYNYSEKADLALSIGLPYGQANDEFGEVCLEGSTKCIKTGALILFGFSYAI